MKPLLPGCEFLNFGPPEPNSVALGRDSQTGELLRLPDARGHTIITGQTGTGKTMMMASMLLQQQLQGANVILLDLIGTLAPYLKDALAHILLMMRARGRGLSLAERRQYEQRVESFFSRVQLLMLGEPSAEHARFNPLEPVPGMTTSEVASSFASAMERVLEGELAQMRAMLLLLTAMSTVLIDSGGAILKDMMELCCMDTHSLQGYLRLLEKKRADGRFTKPVRPDLVYQYMNRFFAETSHQSRRELVASTLRALNLILSDPVAERWLSSPKGNLNLRQLMNDGGSLLVSVPPLNLHTQRVMGGFLLNQVSGLALRRSSMAVSEGQLPRVQLVIDEFQRIFTPEMAENIAVYRNKGLLLTLAHQCSSQIPFQSAEGAAMLESVRAQCSTKITNRVPPKDAKDLALECYMAKGLTLKRDEFELLHRAQLTEERSTQHSQVKGQDWQQNQSQTRVSQQQQQRTRQQQESAMRRQQTQHTEERSRAHQNRLSHEFSVCHVEARARQLHAKQQRLQTSRQSQSHGQQELKHERTMQSHQHQDATPGVLASRYSQLQGQERGEQEQESTLESHDQTQASEESQLRSRSTQTQQNRRRVQEATKAANWRSSHQQSQTHERSQSRTTSDSQLEQWSRSQSEQEKRSESRSQSERQDQNRVASTIQELRQVRDYYSVAEEQIVHAQTLQTLPNRVALVLQQGQGEPQVNRIQSLDMPLKWTTRVGPLDGLAELERLCTPQTCEPEPELNLMDRLQVRMTFPEEER